jgi:hypothetical protein
VTRVATGRGGGKVAYCDGETEAALRALCHRVATEVARGPTRSARDECAEALFECTTHEALAAHVRLAALELAVRSRSIRLRQQRRRPRTPQARSRSPRRALRAVRAELPVLPRDHARRRAASDTPVGTHRRTLPSASSVAPSLFAKRVAPPRFEAENASVGADRAVGSRRASANGRRLRERPTPRQAERACATARPAVLTCPWFYGSV